MIPRRRAPKRLAGVALGLFVITATIDAQVSPDLRQSDARGGPFEVGVYVEQHGTVPGFRPSDPQLAAWAMHTWEQAIGRSIRLVPEQEERSLIRLHWAGPLGGQYGEMRPLLVEGRSGAAVYIRPDTRPLGDDLDRLASEDTLWRETIVYLTCVHELGHALGLPHTRNYDDIMYSFQYGGDIVNYFGRYRLRLRNREDISRLSGLSPADMRAVRARFEPLPPR